jgi:hypothetical protein
VVLTTHHQTSAKVKETVLQLWAFAACYRVTFNFTFNLFNIIHVFEAIMATNATVQYNHSLIENENAQTDEVMCIGN